MDDQQNLLDYETIKSVVAGEKWPTEHILKHYDSYMNELATVKERQSDRSVKCYVDLKQAIALNLLEKMPNFPLKEAERRAKEETRRRYNTCVFV